MGDKPDVFVAHVLIDVDKDQDAREEESQENISPGRDRVRRISIRVEKEECDENESREEEREKKKVKVDLHICLSVLQTNNQRLDQRSYAPSAPFTPDEPFANIPSRPDADAAIKR